MNIATQPVLSRAVATNLSSTGRYGESFFWKNTDDLLPANKTKTGRSISNLLLASHFTSKSHRRSRTAVGELYNEEYCLVWVSAAGRTINPVNLCDTESPGTPAATRPGGLANIIIGSPSLQMSLCVLSNWSLPPLLAKCLRVSIFNRTINHVFPRLTPSASRRNCYKCLYNGPTPWWGRNSGRSVENTQLSPYLSLYSSL